MSSEGGGPTGWRSRRHTSTSDRTDVRLKHRPWRGVGLVALAALLASTAMAGPRAADVDDVEARGEGKGAASGVALTVRIGGLNNNRGQVAVALFASADAFPDQKRALAGQLTRIQEGKATVRFADVRPGVYAIAVLHDENENSKMDFNFLGMPLEGYGFSNDASATFGPPSFDAASFKLAARNSFVPVKVRYFP